jgi:DNA invertase Pin-like site-specific DNA recombinase
MLIGYRRSSTSEQVAGYDAQEQQLLATGCSRIFGEMTSSVAQRDELATALDFVRDGDTLCVTRLDRLARSTANLLTIVDRLEAKGVGLRILDFGGSEVNTKSATGKMLLTMFAAIAEFERALMLERMRAGIAKAKVEGKYQGRAPTARRLAPKVHELRSAGLGARDIAAKLEMSRSSVYRILSEAVAA